ncbi:hypothetical protein OE88DRAFT_519192 [Heliocybe sulcata]|uniref:Uncharacterized protein n=1 Tax=Heliocybe sulcata TaxID=5364 RepID=A0A5C3MTN2_9AGAM|nr:hypothetical protein OE88DRAFT_519192 [Heliocybe sulcata]
MRYTPYAKQEVESALSMSGRKAAQLHSAGAGCDLVPTRRGRRLACKGGDRRLATNQRTEKARARSFGEPGGFLPRWNNVYAGWPFKANPRRPCVSQVSLVDQLPARKSVPTIWQPMLPSVSSRKNYRGSPRSGVQRSSQPRKR